MRWTHGLHPSSGAYLGILPAYRTFLLQVESYEGSYPSLIAFLGLLASLLKASHLEGPVPAYVLHVLHELLPLVNQLPFQSAEARWTVVAALLKV